MGSPTGKKENPFFFFSGAQKRWGQRVEFFRADFWKGMRRSAFQWKKGFSVKRGEAIQWVRGLVRLSTGKAIQWRGSGPFTELPDSENLKSCCPHPLPENRLLVFCCCRRRRRSLVVLVSALLLSVVVETVVCPRSLILSYRGWHWSHHSMESMELCIALCCLKGPSSGEARLCGRRHSGWCRSCPWLGGV